MQNGRHVSLEQIIAKVYRDNGFSQDLDWISAAEWAGDALELLRVPSMYVPKICCLTIVNYRASLPCDLSMVTQVREGKQGVPMRASTDTFHPTLHQELCDDLENSNVSTTPDNQTDADVYNAGEDLAYSTFVNDACIDDYTYNLTDGYIFTSFKAGKVEIAYKAFPISDDGIPLIPDVPKVIAGVACFIAERVGYRLWMQDQISERKYAKLEQERLFYMGGASNALQMPTIDQMESLKNDWVRLIPKMNHHGTQFKHQGRQERFRNHNSHSSNYPNLDSNAS